MVTDLIIRNDIGTICSSAILATVLFADETPCDAQKSHVADLPSLNQLTHFCSQGIFLTHLI